MGHWDSKRKGMSHSKLRSRRLGDIQVGGYAKVGLDTCLGGNLAHLSARGRLQGPRGGAVSAPTLWLGENYRFLMGLLGTTEGPRHPGSSPPKAPVWEGPSLGDGRWEGEEATIWTRTSRPSGMRRGSPSGLLRRARPFSLPAKKPASDTCRSRALMANWWEPAMTEGHSSN